MRYQHEFRFTICMYILCVYMYILKEKEKWGCVINKENYYGGVGEREGE